MLVLGVVVVAVFFIWDTKFAQVPFVPFCMIKERTVVAACVLSMLDFFHYSCFTLFFPSYLQVAGGFSPGHATRIEYVSPSQFVSLLTLGSIGTSVGGAIWNNILPGKLTTYLPDQAKPNAIKIYKSIVVAQEFVRGTPVRDAIDQAYRETQRLLAIAATAALAPMLLVMFALKTVDLSKVDDAKIDENKSTIVKGGARETVKVETH
ncbi:hypothetical protein F66182_8129 [Fusarium sp. NRRL 66182]|nr:hypothetical protein F66182_8129 [Fusarium sp. NRRL 66182]